MTATEGFLQVIYGWVELKRFFAHRNIWDSCAVIMGRCSTEA